MIKRILIKNYMAHKLTVLELSRGVTVITGPNNTGKSAIVEAIRSIAQNPPSGRTAIRHGEKSAVVQIELDSGELIDWERTEKASVYRIHKTDEGEDETSTETYAKFGRVPPDDVRELLRLDPVETETGPVDIHIGNQRYPIFLLDQSGSQAASFFAASTEAEYLLRMQQALKVRTDRGKARRKELARDCSTIEKELERLSPLDPLADRLQATESLYRSILAEEKALPLLHAFLEDLATTRARSHKTTRKHSILESAAPPPQTEETSGLERLIQELRTGTQLLDLLLTQGAGLAILHHPPEMLETRGLAELVDSISGAARDYRHQSAKGRLLDKAAFPPVIHDVEALSEMIGKITATTAKASHCDARVTVLRVSSVPPSPLEVTELASIISKIERTAELLDGRLLRSRKLELLLNPPALNEVRDLAATSDSLRQVSESLDSALSKTMSFARLSPPPEPHDLEAAQDLASRLETCLSSAHIVSEKHKSMARLNPPPEARDLGPLESLISAMALIQGRSDHIGECESIHDMIMSPPELLPTSDLSEMWAQIRRFEVKINEIELFRRTQNEEILRKREEIEQKLSEADKCPLCGHIMDLAHFLEEEHA